MNSQDNDLQRILEVLSALQVTQTRVAIEIENAILDISGILQYSASQQAIALSPSSNNKGLTVNHRTMELTWKDRTCLFSSPLLFRFAARLAKTPNTLVSHTVLLEEVWRSIRSESTIRGAAMRLREQLALSGMNDLAEAIDGSVHGHYRLNLVQ